MMGPFISSRRRALGRLGAVALVTALPLRGRTQALVPLRVASAPDDDVTPILYGQQTGIFRRLGLDVQLQAASSGAAVAAAVAGGAIEIGKSSLIAVIAAHARAVPFTVVAGSGLYVAETPNAGLIVAKDARLRSGADLAGKTASCAALKDLSQLATMAWVDQHGGDSSAVKFLELPASAVPEALQQGRIDASTVANPLLAEALDTGKIRLLGRSFDAIARRFAIATWFATRDFTAKNPDVTRRFADGLRQAATYTNAHPVETIPLLANFAKIKPETIAHMQRNLIATTLDPNDYQPVINAAAKYKLIAAGFSATELLAAS
jgi:NitT/TauT family transport system substrate-binding protein